MSDGLLQLVAELLPRGVLGEIEEVEAGVRHGQVADVRGPLDGHGHGLHADEGDAVGAGEEEQEVPLLGLAQVVVEYGPEVYDRRVLS